MVEEARNRRRNKQGEKRIKRKKPRKLGTQK
jgi:hypothetical protein